MKISPPGAAEVCCALKCGGTVKQWDTMWPHMAFRVLSVFPVPSFVSISKSNLMTQMSNQNISLTSAGCRRMGKVLDHNYSCLRRSGVKVEEGAGTIGNLHQNIYDSR